MATELEQEFFRIWDKDQNKMFIPQDSINYCKVGGYVVGIEIYQNMSGSIKPVIRPSAIYDNAILMQCTGLKDKNGKLIYEGDIVIYDDRDIYPYHTPILNAIIEMRKYQWCMIYYRKDIINANTREPAEQKTWLGFDDFITSRIEVIGNIYENEELLNE